MERINPRNLAALSLATLALAEACTGSDPKPPIDPFDGLRERGLYEDALIVVTSDHGEEFGEHGMFLHHQTYDETLAAASPDRVEAMRARLIARIREHRQLVDRLQLAATQREEAVLDESERRALRALGYEDEAKDEKAAAAAPPALGARGCQPLEQGRRLFRGGAPRHEPAPGPGTHPRSHGSRQRRNPQWTRDLREALKTA